MEDKKFRYGSRFFLWIGLLSGISMLWACGGGSSTDAISSTGTLNFRVAYQGAEIGQKFQAAVIDCAAEGIDTIEADVYNPEVTFQIVGGPWDCSAGQGTIRSVPAGSNRIIVVLGNNTAGDIVFRGEKSGIDVVSDHENNAGTVDCTVFVPNLLTPADGAVVGEISMGLSWKYVAGADSYHIIVSEKSDLKDPVIDTTTTVENYTPSGLSDTNTYFWHVAAIDKFQHHGIVSPVWSFTVNTNVENTSPIANITSPESGRTFLSDAYISFTGSGNDNEDGILSGASLIWRSDVDGIIDMGETFTSDKLSPGTHHITLTATDSQGATGLDTVVITIATDRLPDTGQTSSYTDTFGEDSDYDINVPTYTKLDTFGRELEDTATQWAMVKDNVTGLVWEVKSDHEGMHYNENDYRWQTIQSEFLDWLNKSEFGGYSDWRLPTIHELYTLVHHNAFDPNLKLNKSYFPNTKPESYWSSTTFSYNTSHAWYVYFGSGVVYNTDKNYREYVRAVHGRLNVSNLIDNNDGTVTDATTGLMWQQVDANATAMDWEAALNYCEALELTGFDDWRLPNAKELLSISDFQEYDSAIDQTLFPNTQRRGQYWSSTTYADTTSRAWGINIGHGGNCSPEKSAIHYVRAVRGGQ